MPVDDKVIGARLKKVRNSLGFVLTEIANKMNWNNYQTLLQIEKGERSLTVYELSRLSKIYSKELSYFLLDNEPNQPNIQLAWRNSEDEGDKREIQGKIKQLFENYVMLEELTGHISNSTIQVWDAQDELDYDDIENKAAEFVQKYDLGYRPGVNLFNSLEEKCGLRIVYYNLDTAGSAATAYGDIGEAIFINSQEPPWRRNFDLGHELFHLLSRETYPISELPIYETNNKSRPEKLANAFSAALLMPTKSVRDELEKRIKDNHLSFLELVGMAQDFSVSTEALLWRLANLGCIPQEDVLSLKENQDLKQTDIDKRAGTCKPGLNYSHKFIKLGLMAVRDGKISKGKFCDIFDIKVSKFKSFLAEWELSEEIIYGQDIEISNP